MKIRSVVGVFALAGACSCSSRMGPAAFKEHTQALSSIAAEARLLLALQREGKLTPTFFRTHSEALSDRTVEHLAELARRETDDFLLPTQAKAVDDANALASLLRPLTERVDPETEAELARLAGTFATMGPGR
jgi:hypothetical protein